MLTDDSDIQQITADHFHIWNSENIWYRKPLRLFTYCMYNTYIRSITLSDLIVLGFYLEFLMLFINFKPLVLVTWY